MAYQLALVAAVIVAVVFWTVIMERRFRNSFEEDFPAMTDDEFVQRCGPGTNREVALKVRAIVARQTGIKPEHIHPETNLFDDLLMD